MAGVHADNEEQATLWNGAAGRAWVDAEDLLDRILRPFEAPLVEAVNARAPRAVLDVGCGTGGTTLAIARTPERRSVGIDISEPMIAAARARAAREGTNATFIRADAQTCEFEAAAFEMIVSRFGVMFFDDPVRAFANLRRAAISGGELRFIAWRSPAENPFMTTAERAAAPLLPDLPARRPDGPGQFAFADAARVRGILRDSGWTRIAVDPLDVVCTLSAQDLGQYVTRLGPVGVYLQNADEEIRSKVTTAVRAAFEPYVTGGEARFNAACWMVTARA